MGCQRAGCRDLSFASGVERWVSSFEFRVASFGFPPATARRRGGWRSPCRSEGRRRGRWSRRRHLAPESCGDAKEHDGPLPSFCIYEQKKEAWQQISFLMKRKRHEGCAPNAVTVGDFLTLPPPERMSRRGRRGRGGGGRLRHRRCRPSNRRNTCRAGRWPWP